MVWFAMASWAGSAWQHPPAEVLAVLDAPELPNVSVNPTQTVLLQLTPVRYPPLADKAAPMAKLAGIRIDPKTNGFHSASGAFAPLLIDVDDGDSHPLPLPEGLRVLDVAWTADGERFAFSVKHPDHIGLWVGDTKGRLEEIDGVRLNPLLGSEFAWARDQKRLWVKVVAADRGPLPAAPPIPEGPLVKDAPGGGTPASTYEARDLLASAYDEALFTWYTASQLALVDPVKATVKPIGAPGPLGGVSASPDGSTLLVTRLTPPWSTTTAWYRFARDLELWTPTGERLQTLASLPLEDSVPVQGVPEGIRDLGWRQNTGATLVWTEALDGGEPGRKAAERDRLMSLSAPFSAPPKEIFRAAHRIEAVWWGAKGLALVQQHERERRWRHVWTLNADTAVAKPLFDLSENDRYADPGYPLARMSPSGAWVLDQVGDDLYFQGEGGTPTGDRPFLDRRSLATGKTVRLFQSGTDLYERVLARVDAKFLIVRRESPTLVPNVHLVGLAAGVPSRALTAIADPTPQLRQVTKRIVTFARADGTPLSFTLYLPPGYQEGTRLPTILNAYPREFSDPGTAGQISGSDRTFDRFLGANHLFLALSGYAVLHNTTMPVIGEPETAYDRFIPEIVANAEAAIDEAVRLGVTDRDRVGVIGHSHGGLMTATLIAHSDLFRAGVARSGAYNHTIRPFGFQSERRTFWEAPANYVDLSPVAHAPDIDEPLLIIHGAIDENPGTIPFQSERLFEAIRGTGGVARLVMLPFEGHGYGARESVEHVLAEQLAWFDRYVKPRKAP